MLTLSSRLGDCPEWLPKPIAGHCKEATGNQDKIGQHSECASCRLVCILVIDKRCLGSCKKHHKWDSKRLTVEDLERQDGEDVQEADPAAGHRNLHGSDRPDRCMWPLHALLSGPYFAVQASRHCQDRRVGQVLCMPAWKAGHIHVQESLCTLCMGGRGSCDSQNAYTIAHA